MKAKSLYRTFIGTLLTVLFVTYYVSLTIFSHSHVISEATIVHSHIHTNSHHDTKSGGHTEHSITLIAQTSHTEYIGFSYIHVPTPLQLQLNLNKLVETTQWVASIYFQNLTLRAPPIV